MEFAKHFNPLTIYEGIRDGTLVDKFDKRLISGLIALIGAKLAYKLVLSPTYNFYRYCLKPTKDLKKRYGGGWAVVTGASDGIGLGFCKNLAKLGFNVVMISRDKKKLDEKAKEVMAINQDIEVKTIEFNFNRAYLKEAYQPLFDELDQLNISLLINNVGYGYCKDSINFHSMDEDDVISLYQLNMIPMIHMSKYFLRRATRRVGKRSGMINISSLAALFPAPGSHLYTGSKAFVDNFTQSLAATPIYTDIDIISLNTCNVESNMNRGVMMLTVTADNYAKQALNVLGDTTKDPGHFKHYIYMQMIYNPITLPILLIDFYRNMDSLGNLKNQKPVGK